MKAFGYKVLAAVLGTLALGFMIGLIVVATQNDDTQPEKPRRVEYDYVVIGSGAGGATIAERLSRSGAYSVLVLEAGPNQDENPIVALVSDNSQVSSNAIGLGESFSGANSSTSIRTSRRPSSATTTTLAVAALAAARPSTACSMCAAPTGRAASGST